MTTWPSCDFTKKWDGLPFASIGLTKTLEPKKIHFQMVLSVGCLCIWSSTCHNIIRVSLKLRHSVWKVIFANAFLLTLKSMNIAIEIIEINLLCPFSIGKNTSTTEKNKSNSYVRLNRNTIQHAGKLDLWSATSLTKKRLQNQPPRYLKSTPPEK